MKRRLTDLAVASIEAGATSMAGYAMKGGEPETFATQILIMVSDYRELVRELDELSVGLARLRALPQTSFTADAYEVLGSLPSYGVRNARK